MNWTVYKKRRQQSLIIGRMVVASLVWMPFLLVCSMINNLFKNRTTIGVSDETDHLIIVQPDDSTNYGLCSRQCQKILSPMLLLDSVNHNAYSIPLSKLITSFSCIFLGFDCFPFCFPYWGHTGLLGSVTKAQC